MLRLDMAGIRLASKAIRCLPIRGRGRVGGYLHQHISTPKNAFFSVRMQGGYRMQVPAAPRQSWIAAFTGAYDGEVISFLERYIDPKSNVLDIGASLGFYTIPLALAAQKRGGHVIAFEPVSTNCLTIRRNLELNHLAEAATVVQAALGKDCGRVTLHIEAGGSGNAAIATGLSDDESALHDHAGRLTATEEVPIVALDSIEFPQRDDARCSLMKMDVEGFELDVLEGARHLIESSRPIIVGEFNPDWLRSRGHDPQVAMAWANKNGYRCFEFVLKRSNILTDSSRVELVPVMDERGRGGDVILFPRDRHPEPE
jgi:FkbM family methyltransferase